MRLPNGNIAPLRISLDDSITTSIIRGMKLMDRNSTCVADAAKQLRVTSGRIRQLCIEHNIGEMIHPRLRMLSPRDLQSLRKILDSQHGGRPRKNSEHFA